MGSAGSEYSEIPRICDKTWPVSRLGKWVKTTENTNVYMDAPALQKEGQTERKWRQTPSA